MKINLGALEKDRAGADTGLLTIARNAYPNPNGWGPMPGLTEYGSSTLPSRCLGLWYVRTGTNAYQIFAATATKIYKLVAGVWTDFSRLAGGAYTTASGAYWQGALWGSLLILVNGADAPQVIDIESGAVNFTALAGSPPVSIYIGIVGDFVFLVDATNRRRAVNCGTTGPNTATSWTVGTDLCDEYICPDGGNLTSPPMLGEYGLVMQDGGIARRVILQPGDTTSAFRFEKLEGIKGSIGGYSTVAANSKIFYLAEDGVYSLGPDGANTPIGTLRVNQAFRDDADQNRIEQFLAFSDPYSSRIYWAYYKTAASTYFDGLLGYDWLQDRLFFADVTAQFWAPIVVPGATLEQLDATYPNLDLMVPSLDSRQFQGGRPTIGAVAPSGKLALLSGSNLTATLRVSAIHLVPTKRAFLSEVYPIGEWGDAVLTFRVGKREHAGQAATWKGPFSLNAETGAFYPRVSARIVEPELTIAGDGWTFAQALGTIEQADGLR